MRRPTRHPQPPISRPRKPIDLDLNGPLLNLIDMERARQKSAEGYTAEHDDAHDNGELLRAAVLYYAASKQEPGDVPMTLRADGAPVGWPWEAESWKPKDKPRNLIRAGALCLAEKERLRRIGPHGYVGHVDQKLKLIVQLLRVELQSESAGAR